MIVETYIGCDVSKGWLDFFDEASRRHSRVANEAGAIAAYVAQFDAARAFVVMEATGVCDRLLRHALGSAGVAFSRHNPAHVHAYTRARPLRAKTDRMDAAMLSEYGRRHQPAADPAPCARSERLQSLIHHRDCLVEAKAGMLKRLKQAFAPYIIADLEDIIVDNERRIEAVTAQIRAAIAETCTAAEDYKLLTSAPGVSTVTATALIAYLPELGRRSPKSIAALAGLAPIDDQSGKTRRKSHIRGGRPRVRRALYMAALSAVRPGKPFHDAFTRIAARSGSRKLALIAVARKLLVALNAIIRDRKAFA